MSARRSSARDRVPADMDLLATVIAHERSGVSGRDNGRSTSILRLHLLAKAARCATCARRRILLRPERTESKCRSVSLAPSRPDRSLPAVGRNAI